MKTVRWLHILFALTFWSPALIEAQQPVRTKIRSGILQKLQERGVVRIMVGLNTPWQPERRLSETDKMLQRSSVAAVKKSILADLTGTRFKVIRDFDSMPFLALEVDSKALSVLDRSDRVKSVSDEVDRPVKRFLTQSVPLIGGNTGTNNCDYRDRNR